MNNLTTNPLQIPISFIKHRDLILQLAKRLISSRYRGSILGVVWSLVIPILMLVVYTFVFGVVFKARWANLDMAGMSFAPVLFSGLIVHAFFSECLARSTGLIIGHPQYVKKVVFPLEILPWPAIATALFQSCISFTILLLYIAIAHGVLHWQVLFLPLVLLPIIVLASGVGWWLSSITVYVRDVTQVIGILSTVMLFLGPIFYPVSALPDSVRAFIYLNPIAFIIEQVRVVVIWGEQPYWLGLFGYLCVAILFSTAGFVFFQRLRKGFADVV